MHNPTLEIFTQTVVGVFEDYFAEKPLPGKTTRLEPGAVLDFEMSGMVNTWGVQKGVVVLSFDRNVVHALVEKITTSTGINMKEVSRDFMGEFVNVITGSAKRHLEEKVLGFSLPHVMEGKPHKPRWPANQAVIEQVPFSFSGGTFALTLALGDNDN